MRWRKNIVIPPKLNRPRARDNTFARMPAEPANSKAQTGGAGNSKFKDSISNIQPRNSKLKKDLTKRGINFAIFADFFLLED
jgi:hypothetical protein